MLDEPVHSGDANRGQQAADGRRHQADEEGDQDRDRDGVAGVDGVALERQDDEDEEEREPRQEDVKRDLVRRLLARGALDEGDHVVQERLTRLGRNAHLDLVREDPRAAGDGAAVAAALADHGRRLAGNGGLVDGGDALYHFAVAGNRLAGADLHDVALVELAGGDDLHLPVDYAVGHRLRLHPAERGGLRLAAALGDRLGEVGEQDREPEEKGDAAEEADVRAACHQRMDEVDGRDDGCRSP